MSHRHQAVLLLLFSKVLVWAVLFSPAALRGADEPAGKLRIGLVRDAGSGSQVIAAEGLSPAALTALEQAALTEGQGRVLQVYAGSQEKPGQLPMLGGLEVRSGRLFFVPRFPLQPGLPYRAKLDLALLPGSKVTGSVVATVTIAKKKRSPTKITAIYPSADALPENTLRFYLHFSAPMRGGDSYRYFQLLKPDGSEVDYPFLKLDEELWDPSRKRLTLLCDPGRVKRGLKPREDEGPVLEEGGTFTLVVKPGMPDAHGDPVEQESQKQFRVVAPDDTQPQIARWKIAAPPAASTNPLTVHFAKPLDHGMLHRVLQVTFSDGTPITGEVSTKQNEATWLLEPDQPWQPGRYALVVDTDLEDCAGNSIKRPFEVDVVRSIQQRLKRETVSLTFEIK